MPSPRSRTITEAHPVARYLFLAEQLGPDDTLVLECKSEADARRAAKALSKFRREGRLGPPGSFEPSTVDPKGEGVGFFDRISVGVRMRGKGLYNEYGNIPHDVLLTRIPDGMTTKRNKMPEVVVRVEKGAEPNDREILLATINQHFFNDDGAIS
jgi:hypothetical protein